MKYTPGKWHTDKMGLRVLADIDGFHPTKEHPDWVVAQCSTYCGAGFNLTEQQRANARLIASAPEMAELLLSMYVHVSHGGPTRAEAEAVLRKAGIIK